MDENIPKQYQEIKISKQEYNRLVAIEAELDILYEYGVDNWDGYEIAMQNLFNNNE